MLMTRESLKDLYFNWMYQMVVDERYGENDHLITYRKLFSQLDSIEFEYSIPMDANREADGVNLRYRFGYEMDFEQAMIASYLDDRPSSVLEMILALALRCEESIMHDQAIGDRKGQWFWNMVNNLGLGHMNDRNHDPEEVEQVIFRWLDRAYDPDGKGSLFYVPGIDRDMRTIEIWQQMFLYLKTL